MRKKTSEHFDFDFDKLITYSPIRSAASCNLFREETAGRPRKKNVCLDQLRDVMLRVYPKKVPSHCRFFVDGQGNNNYLTDHSTDGPFQGISETRRMVTN